MKSNKIVAKRRRNRGSERQNEIKKRRVGESEGQKNYDGERRRVPK